MEPIGWLKPITYLLVEGCGAIAAFSNGFKDGARRRHGSVCGHHCREQHVVAAPWCYSRWCPVNVNDPPPINTMEPVARAAIAPQSSTSTKVRAFSLPKHHSNGKDPLAEFQWQGKREENTECNDSRVCHAIAPVCYLSLRPCGVLVGPSRRGLETT